jgi:tryptophanyl-tRNA synthetase
MGELARMTQFKEKSGQKDIYVNIAPLPIKTSDFGWILSMKAEESLQILSNTKNREKIYNNYLEVCQKIGIEPPQTKEELIADYRSQVEKKLVSVGLFDYPALMAADILLYQTTHVPVGEDQKQHIEITRDIAERMNNKYGQLFTIPEPLIKKETARIMGLDDPKNKMSKSASSPANYIALTDDPETIRQKIKRAVTDSGSEIKAGPGKPAISNLLTIFSGVTDKSIPELEKEFEGKGYGEFKDALAEAVVEFLKPIQTKFKELISDEAKLRQILAAGSEKIAPLAQRILADVKSKVGLG